MITNIITSHKLYIQLRNASFKYALVTKDKDALFTMSRNRIRKSLTDNRLKICY